jgi:Tol biopolymer transport system component
MRSFRASRRVVVIAVAVASVVAIPAAGRSEASKKPKPIGKLVKILHDDVYIGNTFVTDAQSLYAGRALRTADKGRARIKLNLKGNTCTITKRTRIIVIPAPGVALRVTSESGEVWCATSRAEGTASYEAVKKGHKTRIATKDPVFGLVVAKQNVLVKVRRGAVVVAGRSGRAKAVIVGRASQSVVPQGGDPRQPQPIALTSDQQAIAGNLATAVSPPADKEPPVVKLLAVPGDPSDQIDARFAFTTAGIEDRNDITFACSLDNGGFFVCAPPVHQSVGPGRHIFAVRAVDAAGNFGKTKSSRWSVTRPPSGWIIFESNRDRNYELYAMDADGSGEVRITTDPAFDGDPAWSPKRDKLAFESDRENGRTANIYVMNVDGSNVKRLTKNTANHRNPKWSPSGRQIAYESNRDGDYEIYVMDADGTHVKKLTTNDVRDSDPAWSPDGTKIAFESDRDGNSELYVMNADGSGISRLTNSPSGDFNPVWSPDGEKIAFDSDRNGNQDIYLIDTGGRAAKQLTTNPARDADPAWSPDGKRIAFSANRDRDLEIYSMNADGSDQKRLTNSGENLVPNW